MVCIVISDFCAPYFKAHVEDREEGITGNGMSSADAVADLLEQLEEQEIN